MYMTYAKKMQNHQCNTNTIKHKYEQTRQQTHKHISPLTDKYAKQTDTQYREFLPWGNIFSGTFEIPKRQYPSLQPYITEPDIGQWCQARHCTSHTSISWPERTGSSLSLPDWGSILFDEAGGPLAHSLCLGRQASMIVYRYISFSINFNWRLRGNFESSGQDDKLIKML